MYESNGPDLKIRGNASHIAEKYLQLARDAQSSGDPIAAENYYQHAEHYFRLIAAAQEHFRQTQPSFYQQQPQQGGNDADDSFDDGDNDQPPMSGESFAPQQQPYYQREQQPPQQHQPSHNQQPQQNPGPNGHDQGDRGQDRFGMHRRRRRHRGGGGYRPDRPDLGGNNPQGAAPHSAQDEGGDEPRQPD